MKREKEKKSERENILLKVILKYTSPKFSDTFANSFLNVKAQNCTKADF